MVGTRSVEIKMGTGSDKPTLPKKIIGHAAQLLKLADKATYKIAFYKVDGVETVSTMSKKPMKMDMHRLLEENGLIVRERYIEHPRRGKDKIHIRVYNIDGDWLMEEIP